MDRNRPTRLGEVRWQWERRHGGEKKGGGDVIKFDIVMCRVEAVRAVSLLVAVRRLARPLGLDTQDLQDMERELRNAAAELQRVEKRWIEDKDLRIKSRG